MVNERFSLLGFIPEDTKDKIMLGLVLGIVGGGSWSGYWRADKFTGSQGREMAADIITLERRLDSLSIQAAQREAVDAECASRIDKLEEKVDYFQRKYWERSGN